MSLRRRMLINSVDEIIEGIAYSGRLILNERPTKEITFNCPGCTNFAIINITRNINSGEYGGLFISVTSVKGGYTDIIATYPTGVGGYTCQSYTNRIYAGKFPFVDFDEEKVTMSISDYTDNEYRWFGGYEYEWIAW